MDRASRAVGLVSLEQRMGLVLVQDYERCLKSREVVDMEVRV